LLLLREERLLEPERLLLEPERLLPLALARSLLLRLELLRLELPPPLDALPRLLLPREDEPDFEEEEELRDAMDCSLSRWVGKAVASVVASATRVNLGTPPRETVGHAQCICVGSRPAPGRPWIGAAGSTLRFALAAALRSLQLASRTRRTRA